MDKLYVIKIGGNVVDDESALAAFLKTFAGVKEKKILVHGGGKLATRLAQQLGIQQQMIDGRRITDAETLKVVTMVYAGYINKNIVAQLQSNNCNALGVTGADGNLVPANKRPSTPIDYGFAGDVREMSAAAERWDHLLKNGFVPVVAPITHDGKGQLLNTNADTIAQELAKAMSKKYDVQLVYSFEKAGVLVDVNDEGSVISTIDPAAYEQLKKEGKIFAGMIPKLDNAFNAIKSGVHKVILGKAELLEELIDGRSGTTISGSK